MTCMHVHLDARFPLPHGRLIHGIPVIQVDSSSAKQWAEMKERKAISTDWNENKTSGFGIVYFIITLIDESDKVAF